MTTLATTHRTRDRTRDRSTTSLIERWAPIGGLIFVVLMNVGSSLVGDVPSPDASEREIANYLADGANLDRNIIGAYLWVLGALAFLWFLTRLRSDLRRAEGGTSPLTNLVSAGGVAFAAVWLVAAALYAIVPYAIELRDAPISDPDLVRVLPTAGRLLLLLGGGFAGVLVLLASSAVIFRTGVLPRWLAWLGIVAATVLVFDVVYVTIFPFWVWVLAVSIVWLVRRKETAATAT